MRGQLATEKLIQSSQRLADKTRGLHTSYYNTVSARMVATRIIDTQQIPVLTNNSELQDANGNFYVLDGYSQVGGSDIVP